MRKLFLSGISVLLLIMLTACATVSPTPIPTPTWAPEDVVNQANPYEWIAENDKNADKGYTSFTVAGVDEFGRSFTGTSAEREGKSVGMFYHVSQGLNASAKKGIFDVEKLVAQYGADFVFKQESPESPNHADHYWGEPLWGYYSNEDIYILKKQLEMFVLAGIDYLVLDVTNGYTYPGPTIELMRLITELRSDGWDVPQVVFYLHSLNNKTLREVYSTFYSKEEYKESWYMKDGKPVVIAFHETEKDIAEAKTRGVTDFSGPDYIPLSQEILDFYFFVEPRWPNDTMTSLIGEPIYDADRKEGFCWIEWVYPSPQRKTSLGTFTNVAVASHPSIPFSFSITRGAGNWGRGFDVKTRKNVKENIATGSYFQACWDTAIKQDSDTVFLVMWNGWVALKQLWDGEYMLADTANYEFSLTIEPAKGYYNDAVYLQMISNMRKYKNEGESATHRPRTIDINGSYAQWYNADAVYRQIGTEAYGRKGRSSGSSLIYKHDAPANNIQEVRTAHDGEYLYFMVRTENDITAQNGAENWMNLFIGTGTPELKGWNGYEYVINRSTDGNTSDIVKLNEDFSGQKVGSADMKIAGNFMFLRVPRNAIGLTGAPTFYFKTADSVATPNDIMEYYVTGSVLPLGRLSYEYIGL